MDRLVNRYLDRMIGTVADDEVVNAAFLTVLNLIDEPTALFSLRVAVGARQRRRYGEGIRPNRVRVTLRIGEPRPAAREEVS